MGMYGHQHWLVDNHFEPVRHSNINTWQAIVHGGTSLEILVLERLKAFIFLSLFCGPLDDVMGVQKFNDLITRHLVYWNTLETSTANIA